MQAQINVGSRWAVLTVWGVVNAVNVLQTVGFLSRVRSGSMVVNHVLGYVILALGIPSVVAIYSLVRTKAGWLQWIGSTVFLAFITLMVVVDYVWPVEFRSPARPDILVPYLVLFFGAILLMGLPMFRLNRNLWLITVVTTILLLGSMTFVMLKGVG
jgi:hypothetical protein